MRNCIWIIFSSQSIEGKVKRKILLFRDILQSVNWALPLGFGTQDIWSVNGADVGIWKVIIPWVEFAYFPVFCKRGIWATRATGSGGDTQWHSAINLKWASLGCCFPCLVGFLFSDKQKNYGRDNSVNNSRILEVFQRFELELFPIYLQFRHPKIFLIGIFRKIFTSE